MRRLQEGSKKFYKVSKRSWITQNEALNSLYQKRGTFDKYACVLYQGACWLRGLHGAGLRGLGN